MVQCKKCGNEFNRSAKIDGKKRNLQRRLFCFNCSPFGQRNTRDLSKVPEEYLVSCKSCSRSFVWKRKSGHTKDQCNTCINLRARKVLKDKCVDYKGGKCEVCGYSKSLRALVFHHRNPSEKEFTIANTRGKWERIREELDKCLLLCSNCHAEEHERLDDIGQ